MTSSALTVAAVVLIAGLLAPVARGQAPRPPNIIVIMTDDQGIGDLGCYGARDAKTPNLDALAASGVRFTEWYAAQPVCSPSRAAVMTGRYPLRAGVPDIVASAPGIVGLRGSEVTLAEVLKTRGYRTGLTGKWHLGSAAESLPRAQGFDSFFGHLTGCIDYFSHMYYWGERRSIVNYHDLWRNETEVWQDGSYMTELITGEATKFIRENRAGPFFLFLPYNAPHYPMHAPARYLERFTGLPRERQVHMAMVAAVDDGVGEILELLSAEGLRERTLVFFQSDNGATIEDRVNVRFSGSDPKQAGNNGGFRGWKFSLFEGGIRVPAFLSWPGRVPAGQVSAEPGIGMDIFATAAAAAGADLPAGRTIDGRDILPVVLAQAKSARETLFWAQGTQRAVRKGRWKLVERGMLGPTEETRLAGDDEVFLTDLAADPGETRNLRAAHPEVVRELTELLRKWELEVKGK